MVRVNKWNVRDRNYYYFLNCNAVTEHFPVTAKMLSSCL